jgi:PhnB protein
MEKTSAQPIPAGHTTVTAGLCISGAAQAIEFYKQAFGAEERERMAGPGGTIMHAELQIGTSRLMLADPMPGMTKSVQTLGDSPVAFYLYVTDADSAHRRAVAAGATDLMPVSDAFWGDRMGQVKDPYGFRWTLATHTKDLTPEEIRAAGEAFMKTADCSDKS